MTGYRFMSCHQLFLYANLLSILNSVLAANQGKRILSATYGLAGCIGVNTNNAAELKAKNCTVAHGGTSAVSRAQALMMCRKFIRDADAMPITFSAPIAEETFEAHHLAVILNSGKVVTPLCAFAAPANEPNEMQTFATVGYYGDGWGDTLYPVEVQVVGNISFKDGSSAKGLKYRIPASERFTQISPVIVQADVLPFDDQGELSSLLPRGRYPNHCAHLYGSAAVTHRVRVVLNGGGTINGVHSLLPNQTDVFQLLNAEGNRISDPIIGLADLGAQATGNPFQYVHDGDNFYDICLDARKGSVSAIERVRMPCDDVRLFLPSGRTPCKDHAIDIGDTPTQYWV